MEQSPTAPTLADFVALCAEILDVPGLSADGNFFDAGGDSITAAKLAVETDERWDVRIDMMEVFTALTIAALHDGMCEASHAC